LNGLNFQSIAKLYAGDIPDADTTAPTVPDKLVASNIKQAEVTLSWEDSTDTESGVM
jgi:hypothetical protein